MTLQAEFAATLVDEWVRAGVRGAVVAPGSRSAPLTLALIGDGRITVHVRLDERSASFYALGCALSSDKVVVVVTTSGTAAPECHAAVCEADLSGVALIVCTTDRPPELHDVFAPQVVAQHSIFGDAVRFASDLGVVDQASRPYWRSYASRLVCEALDGPAGRGPVHANLAFADPLLGEVETLPNGDQTDGPGTK